MGGGNVVGSYAGTGKSEAEIPYSGDAPECVIITAEQSKSSYSNILCVIFPKFGYGNSIYFSGYGTAFGGATICPLQITFLEDVIIIKTSAASSSIEQDVVCNTYGTNYRYIMFK